MKWITSEKFKTKINELKLFGVLTLLVVLIISTFLILLWPIVFVLLWNQFHEIQEYAVVRVLTTLVLFGLAKQLYDIRSLFQHWYGAAEVVLGMLICWVIMRDFKAPMMTVTIGLAGAVYLMVRGIDNYIEGRGKRVKLLEDPVDKTSGPTIGH